MRMKRLLVCRLSALGDVAMTLPVVYSLARQYPDLCIDFLTRPFFARMMVNRPQNIRILEADLKGRHKGFGGLLRLIGELRQNHYDGVADLHNILRSWVIDAAMCLSGKPVAMVAKQRRQRKQLMAGKQQQQPFVERYAQVFARLGFPVNLDFHSVKEEGFPENSHPLPAPPLTVSHPAVGIAPFARYESKTYPIERMREVARGLSERGYSVYLFGAGKGDSDTLGQWERDIEGCTSMAGKFTLQQELALIGEMEAMVTMDSANQHLASLVGTRAVTVWGSTSPLCGFLGYGQRRDDALCLGLDCQPCSVGGRKSPCPHNLACLTGIKTDDIINKVEQIINR